MKRLNIIIILALLFGCKVGQIENKEIDSMTLNDKDFITERTIYKGKSYTLSYSINEDSTLNFRDSKSEENYHYLFSNIEDKPTTSIFISIEDSTSYIFDTNIEHNEFIKKRIGNSKTTAQRMTGKFNSVKRKDITSKFADTNKSDSGYVKNNFVYQKDIYRTYSIEGLIGSIKEKEVKREDSFTTETGRLAWRADGAGITLYEDIYGGGVSYDVLANSGIDDFQEYEVYTINLSSFDDRASSIVARNATTRHMIVSAYEHPNAGGHALSFDLLPRNGSIVDQIFLTNLTKNKLKPRCWLFCKNWNDRISSVGVAWTRPAWLLSPPIFINGQNVNVILDNPIEYEYPGSLDIAFYSLVKTTNSNWWNSGASSFYNVGPYGAEFQIDSRNTDIMFGLSPTNYGGVGWNTIKYNVYVSKFRGNVVQIWQNGIYKFSYPYSYNVGDVINVQRLNSTVNFYHNNRFIGSLTNNGSLLFIDTSIYTAGATIRKVGQ